MFLLSKSLSSTGISSIKIGLLRSSNFSNFSKKFSSSAFRISILLSPDSMYSIKYLACSVGKVININELLMRLNMSVYKS